MPITIKLLAQPIGGGMTPTAPRLPEGGAFIGRRPDCDVVLRDPDRMISGQHSKLELIDGRIQVTDLSSNGTFIDTASRPIGKNRAVTVEAGARLRCGKYRLELGISQAPESTPVYGLFVNTGEAAIPKPFGAIDAQTDETREIQELLLLRGFLEGMNLDELGLPSQDMLCLGRSLGSALRQAIETAMIALRGRADVKQEFGMGSTQIQPAQNNPLKFSPDADEAIDRLFGQHRRGYLDAEQAFAEARRDLDAHTAAAKHGMFAALEQLIGRFDPEILERKLPETQASKKHSDARSRLLWARYRDEYAEYVGADMEHVRNSFAQAFARQYRRYLDEHAAPKSRS